jgi:two-component system sensor histidine kinase VicK
VRILTEDISPYSNYYIDIRYIEQTVRDTQATFLVVDKKVSLVMEIRDDSKATFDEAIGLSTYSNSKAGVLSYVAIFENLWKQTELYEEIKKAHEQLKLHAKAQKEFINVAAHELRTPIQPILGLSQILLSKTGSIQENNELLDTINRNAKRLSRLTDDILDATKIESKSLELKKERFNLNNIIINAIDDIILGKDLVNSSNVQLIYEPKDIVLEADKGRMTQVFSNLISNAIKFTKIGTITIATKIEDNNQIIISVKDTGSGIDPEILPELFSKFTAKPRSGTGLGLFISKSIVEAHGGKIWAENNSDSKGTTFTFILPLNLEAAV